MQLRFAVCRRDFESVKRPKKVLPTTKMVADIERITSRFDHCLFDGYAALDVTEDRS